MLVASLRSALFDAASSSSLDTIETVQKRLENYYKTSAELVEYYKAQDLLYTVKLNIHSGKTSEDVAKEVKEYLTK